MFKRIFCFIITLLIFAPILSSINAFSQNGAVTKAPFDGKVKAVMLTPNVDFSLQTGEQECISMLDFLGSAGINTLIIKTSENGERFYGSDINTLSDDVYPIDFMVQYASKCGFSVYLTLDLSLGAEYLCDKISKAPEDVSHLLNGVVSRYDPNGIIIENACFEKNAEIYAEYMQYGGGIGFENWLNEISSSALKSAVESIKNTDGNVKIGFNSNCSVCGGKCIYNDDNGNLFDFVYSDLDLYDTDSDKPYLRITQNNCKNDVHALINELMTLDNDKNCIGAVFESFDLLIESDDEDINALAKYFSNTLNSDVFGNTLSVSTPTQTDFSTKENSVIFSGSFDSNFPLTINGESVDTNGESTFAVTMPLEFGKNTFTIANNGSEKTFTVTRTVDIFNASTLSPTANITVEGSITLSVSVYAYPDASITAVLNGETITLKRSETADSTGYYLFSGMFTMPPAVANNPQNLGRISVRGTLGDLSEVLSGANVTVAAAMPDNNANLTIDEYQKPITSEIISASPEGSVSNPEGTVSGTAIKITTDNAAVYGVETTKKIPKPTHMKLAANTVDFLEKAVSYEEGDFYITKSGRRLNTSDAVLLSENTISENSFTAVCSYTEGNDTVIKIKQDFKTPYCMQFSPITFNKNIYGDWGDYFLNSFSPDTVSIIFDYCTYASGTFVFPDSSLFVSSSWSLVNISGVQKVALNLTLAQNARFDGVTASYDSQGNLVLNFNGAEHSLEDMVIVVDPGHGYISADQYDPGALGKFSSYGLNCEEASVNQAVAKLVEQKLKSLGATVIRFNTETTAYPTKERSEIARQYNPDLYISIHCNGSTGSSAQGCSTYYFQPFSYPLAEFVNDSLSAFYTNQIYGTDKSEGTYFDYFFAATQPDFPSILIELGYITNYKEALVLTTPKYQDSIAQAIVDGIKAYAAS